MSSSDIIRLFSNRLIVERRFCDDKRRMRIQRQKQAQAPREGSQRNNPKLSIYSYFDRLKKRYLQKGETTNS